MYILVEIKPNQMHKSRDMRFQTMLYVQPAKAQTRSEPLLDALIFYDS